MPSFIIQLKQKQQLAHDTIGYFFEKPKDLLFKAGQFGSFTLLDSTEINVKNKMRSLSFASPPSANDLLIATRFRNSVFKRKLNQLPIGAEIKLTASYGSFTLNEDLKSPAVFITGGIGVAPIRSIVLENIQEKVQRSITVFFSNRRPEDAPFLQELMSLASKHSRFKLIANMTRIHCSDVTWQGEIGYIDSNLLNKYIDDLLIPIYYLVGPAGFVKAMRQTLVNEGVDGINIKTEEFCGY